MALASALALHKENVSTREWEVDRTTLDQSTGRARLELLQEEVTAREARHEESFAKARSLLHKKQEEFTKETHEWTKKEIKAARDEYMRGCSQDLKAQGKY